MAVSLLDSCLNWNRFLAKGRSMLALTIWFERCYRNPARPGFRDFHVDVVEARRFIRRGTHGL